MATQEPFDADFCCSLFLRGTRSLKVRPALVDAVGNVTLGLAGVVVVSGGWLLDLGFIYLKERLFSRSEKAKKS